MKRYSLIFPLLICIIISGYSCSYLTETARVIWGSSIKALDEARIDAETKTFLCTYEECFNTILSMERSKRSDKAIRDYSQQEEEVKDVMSAPKDDGFFNVFLQDRIRRVIVVMGVQGQVDTTEIGIFFTRINRTTTKLEITSLSTSAKLRVSEAIFEKLGSLYDEVP